MGGGFGLTHLQGSAVKCSCNLWLAESVVIWGMLFLILAWFVKHTLDLPLLSQDEE